MASLDLSLGRPQAMVLSVTSLIFATPCGAMFVDHKSIAHLDYINAIGTIRSTSPITRVTARRADLQLRDSADRVGLEASFLAC
jgi:hypothetical protein